MTTQGTSNALEVTPFRLSLARSIPEYRDIPPLPYAVRPTEDSLTIDFAAQRRQPLRLIRADGTEVKNGYRVKAQEWLYHLSGAIAPAELIRFRAVVAWDDELTPSLEAVHWRCLASMWKSSIFPSVLDNHSADLHLYLRVERDDGFAVIPGVRLARVGPEIVRHRLQGLVPVDQTLEEAERHWQQFCRDAVHWLGDCGVDRFAIRGTTATVARR